MANIKELKKKIKSTKGTLKITTAMKLVSAAKLSKAQQAITSARPYAIELEEMIRTISALVENYSHPFLTNNEKNKQAILLVISSDRGLCGGYNSQLAKKVRAFIKDAQEDIKVYFVGKKVKDIIKDDVNIGKHYHFDKGEPTFEEINQVAHELGELFKTSEVGKIYLAYNSFNSAISFTPTIKQTLPMTLSNEEREKLKENFPVDFKYEPSAEAILDTIIPEVLISTHWTAVLDAQAAEHGSRMSSMDSAAKNCKDAIRKLTLKMNKLRQAAITTELIEVVSGAESLNG